MDVLLDIFLWLKSELWPATFKGQVTVVAILAIELLVLWGSITLARLDRKTRG